MLDENWRSVDDFPNYEVSDLGRLRAQGSRLIKVPSINHGGLRYVSLYHVEKRRSLIKAVATLVAGAFCPRQEEHFNTVVHLDGDKSNLAATNLIWRPRAKAIAYHKEFGTPRYGYPIRLAVIGSDETYDGIYEAAMADGVVPSDIERSYWNNETADLEKTWSIQTVFPTGKAYLPIR